MNNITSMRVYITGNCNAKCKNCFNSNIRTNNEISVDKFKLLCNYLKQNGINKLKILGGEPTVHSQYLQIVDIAKKYMNNIYIFTNGTNKILTETKLRDEDSIIYNFDFYKSFYKDTFCLNQNGFRALEVKININQNEKELFDNIYKIVSYDKNRFVVSLTLDCISNIFEEREKIVPKIEYLQNNLQKYDITCNYDHTIPFCFLYKTKIKVNKKNFCCNVNCGGLIDENLNLRFCNQYNEKLINIIQNDKFLPWNILLNYLRKSFYSRQIEALDIICINCVFYGTICNGGCWINKKNISRTDILKYSEFPKI